MDQRLVGYAHKFRTTIASVHLSGRKTCTWKVSWLSWCPSLALKALPCYRKKTASSGYASPITRCLHKGLPPRFQGVSTELGFSNSLPKWPTIPVISLLLFSFTHYPFLLSASCSHPYLSLVYSQNKFYFPFLGRSMYPSHTPSPPYYSLCDVGFTAICCECHWLKKKLLLASGWTE